MKRVCDYIFGRLADYGVKHVFLVVGGGAMYLNDALRKEKRIAYVCHHHEQAAAIAAEGYSRATGSLAVVSVTSGPGGTNALTGVLGQWLDSVPVLYLSGQVKYETTLASVAGSGLRQLGDQEINIVDIARPLTKYAKMITDPLSIRIELEKAIEIATTGRPGPVWLDIPLDVQGASVDEHALPSENVAAVPTTVEDDIISTVLKDLQRSARPLFVAGHGIRIAKAAREFRELAASLCVPVVTTFNGVDLMASNSHLFVGRIGQLGSRAGNFALQNADLVVFIGTRNNIRQVSYNWLSFARHARKIIVDIDDAELRKKTVKGDLLVRCDAKLFIDKLAARIPGHNNCHGEWLMWCLARKEKYPVVLDEYRTPNLHAVHPYHFMEELTRSLDDNAVVVAGNGSACVVMFQAGIVKEGQRIFWNSGCAAMGYDLPASIGAAFGVKRDVVCVTGDGSLQMNLQELQTLVHHGLPVKLFILNNQGYSSIEQTQRTFFDSRFIGCNLESGISFPDNAKLADLYGLPYYRIDCTAEMGGVIARVLRQEGAALCEVVLTPNYSFAPKLSSQKLPDGRIVSSPLEDLSPLLERGELKSNMIARETEAADV